MSNTVQVVIKVTDQATGALSGITGALSNMASVAGGIITADIFGRIGEGLLGSARAGFDFNRSIENATARLNAFTKDGTVSAGILEQLRIEAAKTPFAFEDMANAGTNLLPVANQLNMDLMDLVRTAEILAASNPAEGLEGAAFALKEAASGDFTSIIERFNLSRSAINALKDEGVPSMQIVAQVMRDMGLDMDLVSNLSTTFDGRLSTLKDNFQNLAGTFTQPIFEALSAGLGEALGGLDEAMPKMEETARRWGQLAADSITTFKEAWAGEWEDNEIIQPVHRFVGNTTLTIKQMWTDLKEPAQAAVDFIDTSFGEMSTSVGNLRKAWIPFNEVLDSGAYFLNEVSRLGSAVAVQFGAMDERTDGANKRFRDTASLGESLARFFNALAKAIERAASFVSYLAGQWERLNTAMANGYGGGTIIDDAKNIGGGAPGMGDIPDTSPGATAGQGNVVVPIPPLPTGGRGGDVFNLYVNSPMDLEEVAYRIQKIKDAR